MLHFELMATTTLRLPPELKERVTQLAARKGKSPHAVMLEAIEETVTLSEARQDFLAEAEARHLQMQETGQGLDWEELRGYLLDLAEGRETRAPRKRAWRK